MKTRPTLPTLIFLLYISILGCKDTTEKNVPENFDYGRVENNTYINEFFDLKIPVNPNWYLLDSEQMDRINEMGAQIVGGDNQELTSSIKASQVNTASLLMLYRHELGANVPYNHSIIIAAENIKNFPGVERGTEYLREALTLIKQSDIDIRLLESKTEQTISGVDFDAMTIAMNFPETQIFQDYLCIIKNGFALSFALSFVNDTQKEELYAVLNAMEF